MRSAKLSVIVDPRDRWMGRAACVGEAPAYDESAEQWQQQRAAAVCLTRCPVLEDCRQWARRIGFTGTAAGEKWLNGRRRGRPGPAPTAQRLAG
jgi:hypothetical protein